MTRLSLLRRHPLLCYFVLTFAVGWGGILIVLIASRFDLSAPEPAELGLHFVLMLAGPSVSGLALIAVMDGRAGLHELWSRLIRWEIGAKWYALALLTAPLLLLAVLLRLSVLTSSLLLAVLMHASYTGALMAFFPATTFAQGLIWQAAFAIALWGAAPIVLRNASRRAPLNALAQRDEPIIGLSR